MNLAIVHQYTPSHHNADLLFPDSTPVLPSDQFFPSRYQEPQISSIDPDCKNQYRFSYVQGHSGLRVEIKEPVVAYSS